MRFDLDLFKKITYIHFLTDYDSNDFPYPPLFIWDDFKEERKLRNYLKRIKERLSEVDGLNIYAHFPFCKYKCAFCRQFCFACQDSKLYDEYLELLIKELKMWAGAMEAREKLKIRSIYLGGGTPTNFDLKKFFYAVSEFIDLKNAEQIDIESTLDALLDPQKLTFLKELNLNQKTRLLIGVQSFDRKVLKECYRYPYQKRIYPEVMKNIEKIEIPAVGIDLMVGLPRQTKESFIEDLKFIIRKGIKIIHIYIFLKTPLTILGRKDKAVSQTERKNIRESFGLAKNILISSGYQFTGGDWILGKNKKFLNYQQFYLGVPFKRKKDPFLICVGPTARGILPFYSEIGATVENTNDSNLYRQKILNEKFAIEKIWKIKNKKFFKIKDLIRTLRYGFFDKNEYAEKYGRDPEKEFPQEFEFLEKTLTGLGKFERKGDTLEFKENIGGHLILSKVFYELEVLRKCKEIIKKKYKNLDFDLSFLPHNEDFI